mmetsp:Transcript_6285/g.7752  ORF Transcript_6285/g.7752 Transcript_6285/m.7752 type:complete len:88 (+) Transcript_6285:152-415(+)
MVVGRCYCGAVFYEVMPCIAHALYCHCGNCRRSHSAPMYWVAYVEESNVTVVKGENFISRRDPPAELVWDTEKSFSRCFCSQCGSRI